MRNKCVLIGIVTGLLVAIQMDCYADGGAFSVFFKGKKVNRMEGILPANWVDNKVYVEFPTRLLERDMLLVTSIGQISDNGEGVVGQFTGSNLCLQFVIRDSVFQACMMPGNTFGESRLSAERAEMLKASSGGGVFKSFKIEAVSSGRDTVLVDMTKLFLEHSYYTNPFSWYAGNSMYGFVTRTHRFQEKRSLLMGVASYQDNLTVTCEQGYDVDHIAFGNQPMYSNVPVSVVVNKILQLLPEEPMKTRMADSRIGVEQMQQIDFSADNSGVRRVNIAKRWRIEPSDVEKYEAGELVTPRKPIVFYLDTLFPPCWKQYIREGAEAWNRSFEKIGFRDVVRVVDFPAGDTSFCSTDFNYSTIRYAPMWMPFVQTSIYTDPRSGEILNASVYLHSNIISLLYNSRVTATMAADPAVRCKELPEGIIGELLKVHIMQVVGKCLGLTENPGASYAYPVDSLRSPSFTQKYGLSPSVMDKLVCNYVAQPGDAEKGVLMQPKGIGEYDDFVVKCLYRPIPEDSLFRQQFVALDRWIKEKEKNPFCRYAVAQTAQMVSDPTAQAGDLGNNHIRAMDYMLKNFRYSMEHFWDWYIREDEDLDVRTRLYNEFSTTILNQVKCIAEYIGGIQIQDVRAGDKRKAYEAIPRQQQQAALRYLIRLTDNLSWLDELQHIQELEILKTKSISLREQIVKSVFARFPALYVYAERFPGEYSPALYAEDLYALIWEPTIRNRVLKQNEMELQRLFLGGIIKSSEVTSGGGTNKKNLALMLASGMDEEEFRQVNAANSPVQVNAAPAAYLYYDMLHRVERLLAGRISQGNMTTRLHYEYLLNRIRQAMNNN